MTSEQFQSEVEKSYVRSKYLLIKKEDEYSEGTDRLDQFKKIACLNNEPSTRSLWGMASKHITSIATMCKNPTLYGLIQWREKVNDLRNYTFLLDALLAEMEIE